MSNEVVIMAGGQGTRLRPFTYSIPKPLMPVGRKPIMEILIERLVQAGFDSITICTGYLDHLIRAYFGDGEKWEVDITYSHEENPMGTAGPLGLLHNEAQFEKDFIVVNGDTLTDLDWAKMLRQHQENPAANATAAITPRNVKIDLGVVKAINGWIHEWEEKPRKSYMVAMGIYIMSPKVFDFLDGTKMDMPELIRRAEPVATYLHEGEWFDLGSAEDYAAACQGDCPDA